MVLLTRHARNPDSPSALILLSLVFLLSSNIVASSPLPFTAAEHATIDSLRARGVPEKDIEALLVPRHASAHAEALPSAAADPTSPFAAIESLIVKKIVGDDPKVIGEVLALSEPGDDEEDGSGESGESGGDTKFKAVAKRGKRELGLWIGGLTGKVRRYMPELELGRWVGRRDVEDGGLVVRGQMGKLKVRKASDADRLLGFRV